MRAQFLGWVGLLVWGGAQAAPTLWAVPPDSRSPTEQVRDWTQRLAGVWNQTESEWVTAGRWTGIDCSPASEGSLDVDCIKGPGLELQVVAGNPPNGAAAWLVLHPVRSEQALDPSGARLSVVARPEAPSGAALQAWEARLQRLDAHPVPPNR